LPQCKSNKRVLERGAVAQGAVDAVETGPE
jgi:hypothetical protein